MNEHDLCNMDVHYSNCDLNLVFTIPECDLV
jgi:hypothetical protein